MELVCLSGLDLITWSGFVCGCACVSW